MLVIRLTRRTLRAEILPPRGHSPPAGKLFKKVVFAV
jgi:hypothetical protein